MPTWPQELDQGRSARPRENFPARERDPTAAAAVMPDGELTWRVRLARHQRDVVPFRKAKWNEVPPYWEATTGPRRPCPIGRLEQGSDPELGMVPLSCLRAQQEDRDT